MKVNYTYKDDFFHIYAGKLDNKDAIEQVLQTIMDVIEKFVKMEEKEKQNPFVQMVVYDDGKMIDKKYSHKEKFWTKIAAFKDCYPKVDEYIKVITSQLALDGNIWENDELPLGGMSSYKLAMADKKYILFFISCLQFWDMCHAQEQTYLAYKIYEHYGWCPETEMLFIALLSNGANIDDTDIESEIVENYTISADHPFFIRIVDAIDNVEKTFKYLFHSEEMRKAFDDYLKSKKTN